MSDSLDKLEAYWRMQYQFTLPVVGAMFLVIIVYVLGVGSSPTPAPTLFENEELMSRKQKKAIEKKEKLKQKVSQFSHPFSNQHTCMKTF